MRGEEHLARKARTEMHTGFWYGNLKERDHTEKLCENGRYIHLAHDREVASSSEDSNELLASINA